MDTKTTSFEETGLSPAARVPQTSGKIRTGDTLRKHTRVSPSFLFRIISSRLGTSRIGSLLASSRAACLFALLIFGAACTSPFDGEDPLYDLFLAQKIGENMLNQAASVGGQLTSARGAPYANGRVFCLNSLDGSVAVTAAQGRFEFQVASGTYDCSVRQTDGTESPFVLAAYQDGSAGALGADVIFNARKPGPLPGGPLPPVVPAGMTESGGSSPAVLSPPEAPVYVGGHRAIFLFWNTVSEASSYRIYWSRDPGVDESSEFVENVSVNYYLHRGLRRGASYYYRVAAVRPGEHSELSAELRARTYRAREY